MRKKVFLACKQCSKRNYTTMKNQQNNPERVEVKKFCSYCNAHTIHQETK
ncbi:MAG: 50S ribosomal protein L33 [Bacillota bacterium]|uniref:Large ribosomal subunit protein bL33 n=5 Tax=Fictibacillus TaxID=1329200 RepID=A0A1V3G3N3_9BACL|nr:MULTISPECIES: 50S ribosomal protein L33 [Bacillaceae]MBD7966114.1 50S ribosomal protein L33 [Fictibacillus norfolkensis]MBH0171749.1 50S ribosomal protein L33 [Fictibacillus sp. 18YEL24]MBN3544079.1 50S ribosomal protein L33 [Fictibacillus barbaricus]MBN3552899.1 50S ribosomal protein L33 [Fictibacillus nanhaiensis]MBY6038478.1 50S ribosomal protein L33 [Fictibacillus nanhaiensis]